MQRRVVVRTLPRVCEYRAEWNSSEQAAERGRSECTSRGGRSARRLAFRALLATTQRHRTTATRTKPEPISPSHGLDSHNAPTSPTAPIFQPLRVSRAPDSRTPPIHRAPANKAHSHSFPGRHDHHPPQRHTPDRSLTASPDPASPGAPERQNKQAEPQPACACPGALGAANHAALGG